VTKKWGEREKKCREERNRTEREEEKWLKEREGITPS
jgi:hypothetical protein